MPSSGLCSLRLVRCHTPPPTGCTPSPCPLHRSHSTALFTINSCRATPNNTAAISAPSHSQSPAHRPRNPPPTAPQELDRHLLFSPKVNQLSLRLQASSRRSFPPSPCVRLMHDRAQAIAATDLLLRRLADLRWVTTPSNQPPPTPLSPRTLHRLINSSAFLQEPVSSDQRC